MTERRYTANLSRTQGRSTWAIIFRHPVRPDPNTGKPGLRVRQSLGTNDETEATQLKDQLNQILGDSAYWSVTAKPQAELRFHKRVSEIFYHGMEPEEIDFTGIREQLIPLPNSQESEYRRALLLGTTGAGKTTLLRQLIGADPETERFPSTSTAKTTVHETEVLMDNGTFRAVITFFPMEEVREHLHECISAAVLAAYKQENEKEILRRLLMHVNQRFRFNYVLGNGPKSSILDDDSDDDLEGEDDHAESTDHDHDHEAKIDLNATNAVLLKALEEIRSLAIGIGASLRVELDAQDEKDQRVVDELLEEELDGRLREEDAFHEIADELMDEIDRRFDLLTVGSIRKSKQGWPLCWSWETTERAAFIKAVSRFSSNHAKNFGQLLTPLVNGVRVAGPFGPEWATAKDSKLVLLDGEGLGHTAKSAATISTSLTRRIGTVDAVILVDSATQPMQAAPVAAMRDLITGGNAKKLIFVFTHFDEVKGDNLLTNSAKEEHVLASAENVLSSIGEELGPFAERALRTRLKSARFFVGGIDRPLTNEKKSGKRVIEQLHGLLKAIDVTVEKPEPVNAKPTYDRMNLVLAVKNAAESFHNSWWPRLGLEYRPDVSKEHWAKVKALSRRLATPTMDDEYDTLKPVADLRQQLQMRMYVLLQNPLEWDPIEPSDEKKQQLYDSLAENLGYRMLAIAMKRVRVERFSEWQSAYNLSGKGSTFVRASVIADEIYSRAAPVPDITPSPDRNKFLQDVADALEETCKEIGATLK